MSILYVENVPIVEQSGGCMALTFESGEDRLQMAMPLHAFECFLEAGRRAVLETHRAIVTPLPARKPRKAQETAK